MFLHEVYMNRGCFFCIITSPNNVFHFLKMMQEADFTNVLYAKIFHTTQNQCVCVCPCVRVSVWVCVPLRADLTHAKGQSYLTLQTWILLAGTRDRSCLRFKHQHKLSLIILWVTQWCLCACIRMFSVFMCIHVVELCTFYCLLFH